jgi:hypothetical protein
LAKQPTLVTTLDDRGAAMMLLKAGALIIVAEAMNCMAF